MCAGVEMESYDDGATVTVYGDAFCDACDTPARAKVNGTAGHSHKLRPCAWCECTQAQFNAPEGYDDSTWLLSPHCSRSLSCRLPQDYGFGTAAALTELVYRVKDCGKEAV